MAETDTFGDVWRLPPGTRYHLPDTGGRLPYRHNVHAAEVAPIELDRIWPLYLRRFGPDLADHIRADDIHGWAGFVYPSAYPERLGLIAWGALTAILFDDALTRTSLRDDPVGIVGRVEGHLAAIQGTRPAVDQFDEHMMWDCVRSIAAAMPAAWGQRFRRLYADIARSVPAEYWLRQSGQFPPWREWLEFRRVNLYGFWVTAMAELSIGIDMTERLADDPALRRLEETAVDHILFHNDLYSFPKEAKIGETANTFWLLRQQGASIQEAVNELARLVVAKQNEFLAQRDDILSGRAGRDKRVRRYVTALAHAMGGSLHYHRVSPRYHGRRHDGRPVNNGTVTITDDGIHFRTSPNLPTQAP